MLDLGFIRIHADYTIFYLSGLVLIALSLLSLRKLNYIQKQVNKLSIANVEILADYILEKESMK